MTVARSRPAAGGFSDRELQAIASRPDLMSSSEDQRQATTTTTELVLLAGDRYRVEGEPKYVERTILDAARGSIMQLAWFVEADTGDDLAVNPEHVVALRAVRGKLGP